MSCKNDFRMQNVHKAYLKLCSKSMQHLNFRKKTPKKHVYISIYRYAETTIYRFSFQYILNPETTKRVAVGFD